MKIWKRMRLWMKRREFERNLAEEVRFHREMAGAAFGSEALALEDSRAVWGLAWLDSWKQDVRYALRGFRKAPGFALGAIGAIALGLGLNTTMFTVFNAYALRPYAVHDPYGLYGFNWYGKKGNGHGFSWEHYANIQKQKGVFSDVLASMNLASQVDGRNLFGQTVSGNYFTMLGVGIAYGRPLRPDDSAVIVISHDAWRNKFASDPDLLGRKVYVRGRPFEVVGITTPEFGGLESFPAGFWIPLSMAGTIIDGRDVFGRQDEPLSLIGRLEPGIRPEAAKSAVLAWVRGFAPDAVGVAMQSRATTVPLTRDVILTFLPIFTAFGLVLLIACANVSNMMLARALARQREIAIRVSLGAGRARLIRQLLTESVLLAVPAAVAGLVISEATIEGAQRLLFATLPPAFARIMALADLAPDWRVFGFILLASVVTALLFGLAPAIQTTRTRLVEANRGDFSSDYRPARLRSLLVVTQVAVCTLLLISTAIVLRSEHRVTARNTGLETQGVWDLRMMERYQANAAARLANSPGVGPVAAAWHAPLYGVLRPITVSPSSSSQSVTAGYNFVSPGYFEVFRIPIVRGRIYTEREADSGAPVVVISEAAARKFWPRGDALGETIAIPPRVHEDPSFDRSPAYSKARVIGVVRDAISGSVSDGMDVSCLYFPTKFGESGNDSVLVRVAGDSGSARRRLGAILEQVAPSLSDFVNPMTDVLAVQIYPFRVMFWVAGFLGGVALLMTVSGIYGVMSYVVSQRRKEIGIRVALGAGTRDVVWMVVRQSTRLAGVGAALGAGLALMIAPVFAHQLEVIRPYEMLPYAGSVALVLAAAMAAAFSPSRRAVAIDPVTTLRCD